MSNTKLYNAIETKLEIAALMGGGAFGYGYSTPAQKYFEIKKLSQELYEILKKEIEDVKREELKLHIEHLKKYDTAVVNRKH